MNVLTERMGKGELWNSSFIFLLIANGLFFMSFEMLVPTLPLFVDHIGGQASQVGIVSGIFVVSAILIRPFTGVLVTRFNKKYLLLAGLLVCGVASSAYYLTDVIWQLIIIRVLHGLGFGLVTIYFTTLSIDYIPKNRLGEGVGYFGVGETIMMSVGPMLGILLLDLFHFHYFFYAVSFIVLLAIVLATFVRYRPKTAGKSEKETVKVHYKLIDKRLSFQSILGCLMGIAAGSIISFIPLFAIEKSFEQVGLFFFAVAIAGLVVRFFSGKIYDRFGPLPVLIPSGIFAILGIILLLIATNETLFLIAGFIYGAGFGAAFPAVQTWAVQLVNENEHEIAVSSFFNSFDIGLGAGSILLGVIAQAAGSYQNIYFVAIGVYIIFLLSFLIYAKRLTSNPAHNVKERML
ncbi:MFS transporter [Bacillus sp. 1P02SD]|uniref:MFS transporter n=1 Tax=Bacillus sp. 1P02SD TaxID=3132264 RepID=UPI0039A26E11